MKEDDEGDLKDLDGNQDEHQGELGATGPRNLQVGKEEPAKVLD
tara:strand:- start:64 stop:195 length:132 start_codon:yes stop_codon:yes gene_type:complete